MDLYLDPNKRHDFVLLFDVTNGNPNGDPDAGNMPRIDPETSHGFITDVAIKRKVRDYVALAEGKEIFIQSKSALNTLYYKAMDDEGYSFPEVDVLDEELLDWLLTYGSEIFDVDDECKKVRYTTEFKKAKDIVDRVSEEIEDIPADIKSKIGNLAKSIFEAGKKLKPLTSKDREKIKDYMTQKYYDIRLFGAVLTAGTNAGQVRGPVQITFARSVDPIFPMDVSITRVAITREADKKKKQTEMGRKAIVPYGLYRAHGFYNPNLAARLTSQGSPISSGDLKIFWDALSKMFDQDHSSARGEMNCRGLYIFSHTDEKGLGNAPAHKLFEQIHVQRKDYDVVARSFDDYIVTIDDKQIPNGIEYKIMS